MIFKIIFAFLLLYSSAFAGEYTSLIANQLAVATMAEGEVKEKVPLSECTECNGTGKVKAGDGQTVVWRECDNCYDDGKGKGDVSVRNKRFLYFTAKWCIPCKSMKPSFRKLKRAGWTFGDETCHFQEIDVDENTDLQNQYNVDSIPTFVLIENGKEVKRLIGAQSHHTLANTFNGKNQPQTSLMTPTQLRDWCRTYTGGIAYVEGTTYQQHLMDPNATEHEGGPFQAWQLQGLTIEELQKIHGAQHYGYLTPQGPTSKKVQSQYQPTFQCQYQQNCPNGYCKRRRRR